MAAENPSIALLYSLCITSFGLLRESLQSSVRSDQISPDGLQDSLGRFRVWAGNVGAHRHGRVSLSHRLREAPQLHTEVTKLLNDLAGSLKETIEIASGERQPCDEISWSPDSSVSSQEDGSAVELDDGMNSTTELQELLIEINHIITCLYKLSIAISNPTPRDKLQKCASIDVSHYEIFDIQHASHKFPRAEQYLIDRLGRANTRRRQLFKYYEKHHEKITRYIDLPQPRIDLVSKYEPTKNDTPEDKAVEDGEVMTTADENQELVDHLPSTRKGPGTVATTVNTQTTVSTYVQGRSKTIEVSSDDGQSQTSYATSASGDMDRGKTLRIPPPPQSETSLDGSPFECPYCFSIKIMHSTQSWMKHVFRDLRPYVCTFRDCPKPDRLFDTRHDWYNHETEIHRREWFCSICHQSYAKKELFGDHLIQYHSTLFTGAELSALVDRCERAIVSEQVCPICGERYPTRRLQGHLARHMQQLSLFMLPKTQEEINGTGESLGAHASSSDDEKTENSLLGAQSWDSGDEKIEDDPLGAQSSNLDDEQIEDNFPGLQASDLEDGEVVDTPLGGPNINLESDPPKYVPRGLTVSEVSERLMNLIKTQKGLQLYYDRSTIYTQAAIGSAMVNQLHKAGFSREYSNQFAILTLYDVVLLIDDSASMRTEEVVDGKALRINKLHKILAEVTSIIDMSNPDGVRSVRFLNHAQGYKNVTRKTIESVLNKPRYAGLTRLGTGLQRKVLDPFLWIDIPKKPLLVMVITHGVIEGEVDGLLRNVIVSCIQRLNSDPQRGSNAVSFQFITVGNDKRNQRFFQDLDDDPLVGDKVDFLSMNERLEEFSEPERKAILMSKILLGAISPYWDSTEGVVDSRDNIPALEDSDVEDDEAFSDISD